MPRYDVLLIPCVAVKVPQIDAPTMADAVKKAEEIAELQRLFAPVNRALPSGVSWVEWTEEYSHTLVDELSPDEKIDEQVDSQFLNTQYEPVTYDHTTGMKLQLLDAGTILHEFGPYRRITMEDGYLRCTPWEQPASGTEPSTGDASQPFELTAGGIIYQNRLYIHWAVVAIDIPDYVGLPLRLLDGLPDNHAYKEHV